MAGLVPAIIVSNRDPALRSSIAISMDGTQMDGE